MTDTADPHANSLVESDGQPDDPSEAMSELNLAVANVPTDDDQSSPVADRVITLQVGERRFTTSTSTLNGSSSLAAMLSKRWDQPPQADGSYFIDADGDMFEYILRYLRHIQKPFRSSGMP